MEEEKKDNTSLSEKQEDLVTRNLQQLFENWWNSVAEDNNETARMLLNQFLRGNPKMHFHSSALEQAAFCLQLARRTFKTAPPIVPQQDVSAESLLYQIYHAFQQAISSLTINELSQLIEYPSNPFGALAIADNGYFVPFLSAKDFIQSFLPPSLDAESAMSNLLYHLITFIPIDLHEVSKPINLTVNLETGQLTTKTPFKIRFNPYLLSPALFLNNQTVSAGYVVLTYGIGSYILTLEKREVKRIFEGGVGSWRHLAYTATMFPEAQLFGCDPFPSFCQPSKGLKELEKNSGIKISSRAEIRAGDFIYGLEQTNFAKNAPYDYIYATFFIPEGHDLSPILDGLADGGIFIAPIADQRLGENAGWLWIFRKMAGKVEKVRLKTCSFKSALKGIQEE